MEIGIETIDSNVIYYLLFKELELQTGIKHGIKKGESDWIGKAQLFLVKINPTLELPKEGEDFTTALHKIIKYLDLDKI